MEKIAIRIKEQLARTQTPYPSSREPVFDQTTDCIVIHTSTGSVTLQSSSLAWQINNHNDASIPSAVTLSYETGVPCTAIAETSWEITRKGPVFVAATLKGQWLRQNNDLLARFECELRIFLETGLVQVELTTHNPKRARHPGGFWDLGDPGSVHFRELAVETTLPAQSVAHVTPQATDKAPEIFHLLDFQPLPGFQRRQELAKPQPYRLQR